MAGRARRRPACKLCCTDCRQRWNVCQTRHGEGSAAASGLCATCGLRGTLAFAGGRRLARWRLGARPAAAPEPCHRMSWYCEAPGCTRVDLHARCGLGSDVTAAPLRCPEARAGRRPADHAHSPSTTSPAPPACSPWPASTPNVHAARWGGGGGRRWRTPVASLWVGGMVVHARAWL